jgi:hypothetical protein
VGELIEFKQKYPNAQAVFVKTSEQKWWVHYKSRWNIILYNLIWDSGTIFEADGI